MCIVVLLAMCYCELKDINERDELNRGLIWEIETNTDNVESRLSSIETEISNLHFDYNMNS